MPVPVSDRAFGFGRLPAYPAGAGFGNVNQGKSEIQIADSLHEIAQAGIADHVGVAFLLAIHEFACWFVGGQVSVDLGPVRLGNIGLELRQGQVFASHHRRTFNAAIADMPRIPQILGMKDELAQSGNFLI